jgi:hypothetical protein
MGNRGPMATGDGEAAAQRVLDLPGLSTSAEAAAWDSLRERVTISLARSRRRALSASSGSGPRPSSSVGSSSAGSPRTRGRTSRSRSSDSRSSPSSSCRSSASWRATVRPPRSPGPIETLRHKSAELLGRSELSGVLLLRDLKQLYLTAQETEMEWVVLAQVAQAVRDRELLASRASRPRRSARVREVVAHAAQGVVAPGSRHRLNA